MPDFEGEKVLILGGLGFIGSSLALRLVELGADVTLVDAMLPQLGGNLANIEPIKEKCHINFSDIRDQNSLSYLVADTDIIFNMAGQTSHSESMIDPFFDLEINCAGHLLLLDICRKHNPEAIILYASTRQVYGTPQYLPVDEKHPLDPPDINGIHKLAAEQYSSLYTKVHGMKCICLRLTNTYGPRQHVKGNKQGFTGIFIRKAISGENIQIYGNGSQLRDFNYIDDVVDAFLLAASNSSLYGHAFNLGADEHCSLLEFVNVLHQFCDFEHEIVPFPAEAKAIDIGDYYGDFNLFRKATAWAPKVSIEEGLRRTIEYFAPRREQYL